VFSCSAAQGQFSAEAAIGTSVASQSSDFLLLVETATAGLKMAPLHPSHPVLVTAAPYNIVLCMRLTHLCTCRPSNPTTPTTPTTTSFSFPRKGSPSLAPLSYHSLYALSTRPLHYTPNSQASAGLALDSSSLNPPRLKPTPRPPYPHKLCPLRPSDAAVHSLISSSSLSFLTITTLVTIAVDKGLLQSLYLNSRNRSAGNSSLWFGGTNISV
jgi:hypothetical protein